MFPHPYMAEKLAAERRREILRQAYRQPRRRQPGRATALSWCAGRGRQLMTAAIRLGRRIGDAVSRAGWPNLGPVRLDADLRNQTARLADAEGVSLAEIVRRALRQYLRAAWAPGSRAAWHLQATHAYVVKGPTAVEGFQLARHVADQLESAAPGAPRMMPQLQVRPPAADPGLRPVRPRLAGPDGTRGGGGAA